jgi:ABC-type transporter MlaC component
MRRRISKKQLTTEFRSLLMYTYSGAISQIRDQKLEYKPLRADPADTEVIVNTQVIQPRGEPIQLSYRLEKTAAGWKIYDVNVLGAWLVETYKGSFAAEIGKSGDRRSDQGIDRSQQETGWQHGENRQGASACRTIISSL